MKNLHAKIWAIVPLLLIAISFPSCKKNDTPPATPPKPAPAISDFSPKRGETGTTVVITGTNFDSTAENDVVKFNGVVAAVTQATATQLTVTVPSGVATGKITVTVKSQTSTSATDFKVNTALMLSVTHGITNQLVYLTGGTGFGSSQQ